MPFSFTAVRVGTIANDGTGDVLRLAYQEINANFALITSGLTTQVLATSLTGLNTSSGGTLTSADTVLSAFGKLENRVAIDDAKVTFPFGGSQTQNRVLASPNGSNGSLTVRALVVADLPTIPVSQIGSINAASLLGNYTASPGNGQQITIGSGLSLDPVSGILTATSGSLTSFSSGNLPPIFTTTVTNPTTVPNIAFALTTQTANTILAGPTSGGSTAPTFRALVANDIPSLSATYLPVTGGTLTGILNLASAGMTIGASTFVTDGVNTVALVNGTNAQRLNIYSTSIDSGDYKRLSLYGSGGDLYVDADCLGTPASTGNFYIRNNRGGQIFFAINGTNIWSLGGTGIIPLTDNIYDIGDSTPRRPRTIYAGTSVVTPALSVTGANGLDFLQQGAYGGSAPGFTPGSGVGWGVDKGTRELWFYFNSAWHDTGIALPLP